MCICVVSLFLTATRRHLNLLNCSRELCTWTHGERKVSVNWAAHAVGQSHLDYCAYTFVSFYNHGSGCQLAMGAAHFSFTFPYAVKNAVLWWKLVMWTVSSTHFTLTNSYVDNFQTRIWNVQLNSLRALEAIKLLKQSIHQYLDRRHWVIPWNRMKQFNGAIN